MYYKIVWISSETKSDKNPVTEINSKHNTKSYKITFPFTYVLQNRSGVCFLLKENKIETHLLSKESKQQQLTDQCIAFLIMKKISGGEAKWNPQDSIYQQKLNIVIKITSDLC